MAITNALMYSRVSSSTGTGTGLYKKARLGATRLNFYGPHILCTVGGTARTYNFDRTNWKVSQKRRGQPTSLTIEFFGFTPTLGLEVILGGGALTNRLFRGKITSIEQVRLRQNEGRTIYACTCLDWAYDVDAVRNVTASFTNTSGTTIVGTLMTTYAPAGFTAAHVEGNLAAIDTQFTMQSLNEALQQLCDRLGCYFYWDSEKDLHFFTSENIGIPAEALTSSNKHVRNFRYRQDIEDLRNRIYVEGAGTTTLAAVSAGAVLLPVKDVSTLAFASVAKLESQLVAFSAIDPTGHGTAASAGLLQSPSAPTAAVAAGQSGDITGTVSYVVVHRLPGGDSEVSPASGTVTINAISAPASPPNASVATGASAVSGNLAVGSYQYKATYVTAKGETLASSFSGTALVVNVGGPGGPTLAGTTGGSMTPSVTYYYAVSYVTAAGETQIGPFGIVTLSAIQNAVSLTGIPTSADARVTARNLYRVNNLTGQWVFLATVAGNVTTTYTDTTATASLSTTPAPNVDTSGSGQVNLTTIPTSADARVTARNLYRYAAGAFKFLATIAGNVTTTYTDNIATNALGGLEPTASSAGGGVVTVTVPTGGATVTARRIYRTVAGGSVYKYTGSINDNVTATYTDSKSDGNLGDDAPPGSTVRTEAGSTSLIIDDSSAVFITPTWLIVGTQLIYCVSMTTPPAISPKGNLHIPASGEGAILSPIAAGTPVTVAPQLGGITVGGVSGLASAVTLGETVNLLVQADDATSQGTYGVRQYFVQDRRGGIDASNDRATAELALRKDPRTAGSFESTDPKIHAGAPLTINNWGLTATVTAEQVDISPRADMPQPIATVQFASRSIDDLYSQLRQLRDRVNR
jgi:hypothetical protein